MVYRGGQRLKPASEAHIGYVGSLPRTLRGAGRSTAAVRADGLTRV